MSKTCEKFNTNAECCFKNYGNYGCVFKCTQIPDSIKAKINDFIKIISENQKSLYKYDNIIN